jgi:uncharacterized DUF497 family protein
MYTWAEQKNYDNKEKHGFYLSEITDVFDDPHLIEWYDDKHSSLGEDRYICLGSLHGVVILFIVYTTDDNNIHLISGRKAEPHEERLYNEHLKKEIEGN